MDHSPRLSHRHPGIRPSQLRNLSSGTSAPALSPLQPGCSSNAQATLLPQVLFSRIYPQASSPDLSKTLLKEVIIGEAFSDSTSKTATHLTPAFPTPSWALFSPIIPAGTSSVSFHLETGFLRTRTFFCFLLHIRCPEQDLVCGMPSIST